MPAKREEENNPGLSIGGEKNPATPHYIGLRHTDLALRFNEDKAVWRSFDEKRALRRLLGSRTPLSEETQDRLDWEEAERECRPMRAIGFFHE